MAAAHTFFVANPEHMEMRQNLDYYQRMSGVKEEDFKDLEAKPHMVKSILSPLASSLKVTFTRLRLCVLLGNADQPLSFPRRKPVVNIFHFQWGVTIHGAISVLPLE